MNTCNQCQAQFAITESDRQFYQNPDQRHYNRLQKHKAYKLSPGTCGKCGDQIEMVQLNGTVYCEKCYLGEVY